MGRYEGNAVVVTGAGTGIGYGIARAFAHEGAQVALNDIRADLATDAAARINAEIGTERVFPYPADMGDTPAAVEMVESFAAHVGRLDALIANAGITHYIDFLECTPAIFDRLVGVNLRGTYFTAQAAAKRMIADQIAGRIVLISSVTGLRAIKNFSVYSMTKAGIQMLSASLALELGGYGITVNTISPGAILTERTLRDDPHYAENWAGVNLNGRIGMPEDIAATALFLCSPESLHITGQNIVVDGGWATRSPIPTGHPDKPDVQDLK
ncbi:MAG: SDR family oxidoreductase [Chloroflexota bacterium]|nr:SDR family oxidoreductase [Chloroflexota bacterium]